MSFTFNLRFWAFGDAAFVCAPRVPYASVVGSFFLLLLFSWFSVLFSFLLSSVEIVFYMAKCNLCNLQTRQTAAATAPTATTNSILCYTLKVKSLSIFVDVVVVVVAVV